MLFNSLDFLIFFLSVVFIYYISPHKSRWVVLLISSIIFYMAYNPIFILLILFCIFINWIYAIKIYRYAKKSKKNSKKYLIIAILINFSVLFIFKYLNFINTTIVSFINLFGFKLQVPSINIFLPLGISFYTFQGVSYIIDVYRNKYKPEASFLKFALFKVFFPPLIAGPIERADNLMPQLFSKKEFNMKYISLGMKYILLGFFKKIVIADRLSDIVTVVYNNPKNFTGFSLILATLLFGVQIYCDFSGYTDIAIGCSKVLGINLTENFKKPYLSKSIKEFWRRWHISLSTWFRDYLYIPLGGNRVAKSRLYFNIFITFLVSGLWHGANWTFIIWGMLHGIYQIIGDITYKTRNGILTNLKLKNTLISNIGSTITTFLLVSFAWIFFRANTISDAFYISKHLFSDVNMWFNRTYIYNCFLSMNINFYEFRALLLCILILFIADIISKDTDIHILLNKKSLIFRYVFYYILLFLVMTLGVYYNAGKFIYFQF